MGGKLSKRKKGYNVSDPKAQKEETPGNEVQKQTEEASEKESEPKSESKPENVSSTATETKPTEKPASEVPVEAVVKAAGALLDVPRETSQEEEEEPPSSQVATQEPNAEDSSTKTQSDTAPVKEKVGSCKSREEAIPSFLCVSELPEADVQEIAGNIEGLVASSPPGKVPQEISSGGSLEEGGSSIVAPQNKDETCPVALKVEPGGVPQEQSNITGVLPKKPVAEINQILEPDSGPTEQPTGDTGTLELASAEVPPPERQCSSDFTIAAADVSNQQDSQRSAPDTVPDPEDIAVIPAESQVNEQKTEEKPNPTEPTLPQGKTVENIEMPPVLHTESEALIKSEISSPKDTETEEALTNAVVPELSSVNELPADEKTASAGIENVMAENLAEEKPSVEGLEKVLDLSVDPKVRIEAEATAVPRKDASPNEEEHEECADSAEQPAGKPISEQTAEKPTEPQQGSVNGINEPEEPQKSAVATNGCDLPEDVDLIGSPNAPVCEIQEVISVAQVELV